MGPFTTHTASWTFHSFILPPLEQTRPSLSSTFLVMSDSRPNSANEKATVVAESKPKGFFSRRKAAKAEKDIQDEKSASLPKVEPVEPDLPPASFTSLFR